MFNKTKILTAATSLVGVRADANAIYTGLSAALKASNSGLYVNDLPGVTNEIIAAALSNDATDASTYLTNVFQSEVLTLVSQFIESNKQRSGVKELLSNQPVVSGVAKFTDKIIQNARFVGYLIKPHQSNNIQITITQLGFQANATQATNLKIYLYETSQKEALATFDFDINKEDSLVWRDVTTFIVNYLSTTGGTGQMFYLGYYEKDPNNSQAFQLQGQALRMDFDCGCSGSPKLMWSKYMGIYPIEINNSDLNWDSTKYTIPTPDDIWSNITTNTYGLLLKVNVKCDITDLIVSNISMFAKPLQHAISVKILLDAFSTTRINVIADSKREQSRDFAMHYKNILNGYTTQDGVKVKGLLELLTVDFSGIDKICAPCTDKQITFASLIR
jgi:hypothetical protein